MENNKNKWRGITPEQIQERIHVLRQQVDELAEMYAAWQADEKQYNGRLIVADEAVAIVTKALAEGIKSEMVRCEHKETKRFIAYTAVRKFFFCKKNKTDEYLTDEAAVSNVAKELIGEEGRLPSEKMLWNILYWAWHEIKKLINRRKPK